MSFAEWGKLSLCQDMGSGMFFPTKQTSEYIERCLPCNSCPVKRECRNWAIIHDEYGIWGGLTKKERNRIADKKSQYSSYPGDTIRDRLTDQAIHQGLLEKVVLSSEVEQYVLSRKFLIRNRTEHSEVLAS